MLVRGKIELALFPIVIFFSSIFQLQCDRRGYDRQVNFRVAADTTGRKNSDLLMN